MECKICSMCKNEKHINNFYLKKSEGKKCNSKTVLKRYHDNKFRISNQRRMYHEKNEEKLLQKQNARYIQFEELVRLC